MHYVEKQLQYVEKIKEQTWLTERPRWLTERLNNLSLGLSKVLFQWEFPLQNLAFDMEFVGGFVGVSQDQQTLAVRPEVGWAVLEANQPNN